MKQRNREYAMTILGEQIQEDFTEKKDFKKALRICNI